ncbi:MAG: Extracellular matrix protein [Candidatus Magasanikbacteria bacterium GW2011_GWA2_41_55]|uniref:Extracellular matrix protein n=1 Tax=Candidatus Magasanikbacteria bacterium GW2011_GWA2_41_55 TaxID=1619038 RepID=A0A0G0WKV7_9BACT|nr:MAG: Extracellular matrix protein [Candidatus Magasanikbacteria bacterium GW2011_GWA2_41_55]
MTAISARPMMLVKTASARRAQLLSVMTATPALTTTVKTASAVSMNGYVNALLTPSATTRIPAQTMSVRPDSASTCSTARLAMTTALAQPLTNALAADACTKIDSCQKDVCVGETIVCNDNNPCTDDSCDQKNGCVYTPNNNNPCEDGSLCTIGDFCDAGKCQAGKELKCDDGNICTDNVCQTLKGCIYPANQAGCDDGNGCTVGDICADIACVSGTNICQCATDADCVGAEDNNLCNGTLVCDTAVMPHKCIVNQDTIITCNTTSDTACSKNTCQPKSGKCEMTAVNESGACNDDNACTSGDIFNECTNDVCQNSQCAHLPITDGADCDDGSVCTIIDACKQSKCVGTAPLDCDDNNECTLDVCNKTLGCQHSKPPMNGKACDNGDACTVNDTCQSGACQAGTQTCDCYTTPDCASKEDGDLCNGTLVCDTAIMPHKCVLDPTSVITCPTAADTVCIKNTCQPASGKCEMEAVNEGKTCAEGQCLAEATCQSGQCAVVNKPDGTECDDGQSCNSDSCQSGICVDMPFASANFDTGALDAGWQITNFATPYKINGTQGYTSSPNSLVFAGNGTDAWAVLTSPTFSLQSGHTATLTFDHTTGQGGTQSFAVQIHTASGAATLLEKTNAFLLPWTHYILPLDNYNGEVWLTFHFTGAYIFEAIDSISVGCP